MTENVHYGPDNPYPFSQMKTGCLLDDRTWDDMPGVDRRNVNIGSLLDKRRAKIERCNWIG